MQPVLTLTPTPPANAFVPANQVGQAQPVYPLEVHFCETCFHSQLLDVVSPEELFSEYVYVSGTSAVFRDHFARYASVVAQRYPLAAQELVVDIGSNDGT